MTLLNAPAYDERRATLHRNLLIGAASLIVLLIVLTFAGILTGHGWLFSNTTAEHHVNKFLTDIEQKNFNAAYGVYMNDADWQQHPEKYSFYPLKRFTEDWTTYSPVGPILSHHVDKSVTDGSGAFGTTIIVASTVQTPKGEKRLFIPYQRSDGTLSYPPPHIFEY